VTAHFLVERQLALEGIGFDPNGRLIPRVASEPTDIPRFFVIRHAEWVDRYYRADLPDSLVERLAGVATEGLFDDDSQVKNILSEHAPCRDVWRGASYTFSVAPSLWDYPDVRILSELDRGALAGFDRELLSISRPIFAIFVDGNIASTCVSAREDEECAEAWVETLAPYRRRGYGRQVTAAWGHSVVTRGKLAFYSHARDNLASQGIARSLGLAWFLDGAGYL
jgi:hypothetical protein